MARFSDINPENPDFNSIVNPKGAELFNKIEETNNEIENESLTEPDGLK